MGGATATIATAGISSTRSAVGPGWSPPTHWRRPWHRRSPVAPALKRPPIRIPPPLRGVRRRCSQRSTGSSARGRRWRPRSAVACCALSSVRSVWKRGGFGSRFRISLRTRTGGRAHRHTSMSDIVVLFDLNRRATAPAGPPPLYPARVARQLALAHALQARIASGEFEDQAQIARALGLSPARGSQLFDLLLLSPDIQQEILFLKFPPGAQPLHEAALRPIAP